jgi:glutathione S-transferase/GST-like protein
MALELYHWEPNANSGEVLILLKEKGLEFTSHYVDVLAFEQHAPAFLKVNRHAQVPVLVHDGKVLTETGFILQYIEQAFPAPSFTPRDPRDRYWVNVWIKYANEYIAPAVARLGVSRTRADLVARATPAARERLKRAPPERQQAWAKALEGYSGTELEIAKALLPLRLERMEAQLAETGWLAGPDYSLADIAVFPAAASLPGLTPDLVNATATPQVMAWLDRMNARPAVRAALAMARTPKPEAAFAPGPEGSRWG